ncbi:MAG TPA: hypothetical protein VN279_16545 [Rhodocyclaceae bacterium]|jgi:hypothetical protein|nr:hypothetical protein [Rhodocyclaceae bacterium]
MDETAFRDARRALNPQPCAFERAVMAGCCGCSLALRRQISERETVACASDPARARCAELRSRLLRSAYFALRLEAGVPVPHAKEMKAMCGGLLGLQRLIGETESPADVGQLVSAALRRYGDLDALPYSELMPSVAAFELRRRGAR